MKKTTCFLLALMSIFIMASCSAKDADDLYPEQFDVHATPAYTGEESEPSAMNLVTYDKLDAFISAASAAASTRSDPAELGVLESIRLPASLPDGYQLYKITAGAADIAFWYLPKECLVSEDAILDAEAFQKHFMFIDSRDDSFESFVSQMGGSISELTEGKYYIAQTSSYMINWKEDNRLLSLYLPADMEVSEGVITAANALGEKSEPVTISLESICQTERIKIDRLNVVEQYLD